MASKDSFNLLTKIGHLWLRKNIFRALVSSIVLIVVQLIVVVIIFPQLPPKVPLFYSRPWGNPQLANSTYLLLLPGLSLAILLINAVIAAIFIDQKSFYSFCLTWASTIFSTFCLITLVKIVQIIIL